MFEIVCEVANTSGKTLTIETSIPEAEKPDVQILKSGQQMGVFASPTRSTVKITVVSVEDADRIETLEAALREPTLPMLLAGKKSLYSCSEDPEIEDARACFLAMARKALEDKQ